MTMEQMVEMMKTNPKAVQEAGGTYSDNVANDMNTESKLPTAQMPKGADPSPFAMGPMAPSQR
jgi:hypothetical protein